MPGARHGDRAPLATAILRHEPDRPFVDITKELDVRFAIYYVREDLDDTIGALDTHRLNAATMVTDEIELHALPARFAQIVREPDAGKVIVRP